MVGTSVWRPKTSARAAHDLAEGGVLADGVDQGRHQVDLGVGGLGLEAGQPGVDGGLVAVLADLAEPLELATLVLVGDLQDVDRGVVVALAGTRSRR